MWIMWVFFVGLFLEIVGYIVIMLNEQFFFWWIESYAPNIIAVPMWIIGIIMLLTFFGMLGYKMVGG